jgi:hypothetical protein
MPIKLIKIPLKLKRELMVAAVIKPDMERSTNEKARKICLREFLR